MSGPRADRRCDVVVVGGGIVGCATAYYLARRGVRVILLERGEVAGEQSGRNWGFVRQQGRDPAEVPLMVAANRIWRGLEQELDADLEWIQGGNLALASTPERLALFEGWLPTARENGVDTRLVTPREIQELLPGMVGAWVGGLYTASDGHAEPAEGDAGARARGREARGELHEGCAVEGIATEGGRIGEVRTELGVIRAGTVVCAAGAWSARLLHPLGLHLPQRWVRATVARTTPAPPLTRAGVWGPAVSFRQRRDGTPEPRGRGRRGPRRHPRFTAPRAPLLAELLEEPEALPLPRGPPAAQGASPGSCRDRRPGANPLTWDRGLGPAPNPAKVNRSLQELRRLYPALGELQVTRSWAGYIDATPDAIPVIGEAGPSGPRRGDRLHGPRLRDGPDRGPPGRRADHRRKALARPPRLPILALCRGRGREASQRPLVSDVKGGA